MATEYIETEVKFWVENLDAIRDRLVELGATRIGERVLETNVRLDQPDRSLSAAGEALRLRWTTPPAPPLQGEESVPPPSLTGKGAGGLDSSVLTYKSRPSQPVQPGYAVKARLEMEVEVGDFEQMQAILERLGFETIFIYEKYRETFRLGDTEVMLDELPYGYFVEIEGDVSAIDDGAAQLGLTAMQRVPGSYFFLFEALRRRRRLPFRDLTFANFVAFHEPSLTAQDLGLSSFSPIVWERGQGGEGR